MIGRHSVGDGLFGFMVISVTMAAAFSYVVIAGVSKEQERQIEMSGNRIGTACWYKQSDVSDWRQRRHEVVNAPPEASPGTESETHR